MAIAFASKTEALLDRAQAICGARGVRLTSLRREVLGLILEAAAPAGAYELLDRLRQARPGAAPPTVYRALDFLLEQGLVHRLERLAAFVGCVTGDHDEVDHAAQFLICRECGRVTELEDAGVAGALAEASAAHGFEAQGATVEVMGRCAACTGAAESAVTGAGPA